MTYIIAGKLIDQVFLVADCVSTNQTSKEKSFNEKVNKLSCFDNSYYTVVGNSFVNHALDFFEIRMLQQRKQPDYFTGTKSILSFVKVLQRMIKYHPEINLTTNRIVFIGPEKLVFHDLEFNSDSSLKTHSGPIDVPIGFYVDSALNTGLEKITMKSNENIEDFCKKSIGYILKKDEIDLRNRFTRLQILNTGEVTLVRPFEYFSDMIALYFGLDYNLIDDADFVWDID